MHQDWKSFMVIHEKLLAKLGSVKLTNTKLSPWITSSYDFRKGEKHKLYLSDVKVIEDAAVCKQ